jgi:hypothetical protein
MQSRVLHKSQILTRFGCLGALPLPGFYSLPFSREKGIGAFAAPENQNNRLSEVLGEVLALKYWYASLETTQAYVGQTLHLPGEWRLTR